jgi:hypothetical protein
MERAVGIDVAALNVDGAPGRGVLAAYGDGPAAKVDVAIAVSGVDPVRDDNLITINAGVDRGLDREIPVRHKQRISQRRTVREYRCKRHRGLREWTTHQ